MIDPYRMVVVSVIASFILLLGLFVYKRRNPKKKINLLLLLILFSLLPVISIFRPGAYESGDFNIQVYRSIAFFDALQEGNILPTWPEQLNATYGYPVYFFAAPLPYYLASLFHFFGFSFITSMKLILMLSFVASGITMYLWIKENFGKVAGFIGGLFYLYAPYHLVDMHFRASVGDTIAYAFLPLTLLAGEKLLSKPTYKWFLIGAISMALQILAHPLTLVTSSFIFLYFLFKYLILEKKNVFYFVNTYLAIGVGFALSAFYWIPLLIERRFTFDYHQIHLASFQPFLEYIYSPWRYGLLFQGHYGELSFIIGYIQWIIIFLALGFLLFKKITGKKRKYLLFFLGSFIFLFLLMQSFSQWIWLMVPILNSIQFSYRLSFLLILLVAFIAALVVTELDKKWILAICVIAVFSTILNWGHRTIISEINDLRLIQNLPYATYQGEGGTPSAPIWRNLKDPWMREIPKEHLEIINGSGKVQNIQRRSTFHEYIIHAQTPVTIKENTLYYPGWTLNVNNNLHPINFQNSAHPGIITFQLPPGLYKIELALNATPIRYFAQMLSLITLIVLLTGAWYKRIFTRYYKKQ